MRRTLILALTLAAVASGAQAQPRGAKVGFFISPAGEPFRDGDGLEAWFAGADTDKDGAITPAEFRADALRFFKVVDKTGDGQIEGREVQNYEKVIAPEIIELSFQPSPERRAGQEVDQYGNPRPQKLLPHAISRYALLNTPQPVRAADEDFNGRITEAEWTRAANRRFGLIDKAKAGKLTLDALRPGARKR